MHAHMHTHTHPSAPSIYENDDIKKGILLQMFGGTRKDFQDTGRGRFRAEVNILLCGDPGTSKSQLLQVCVCVCVYECMCVCVYDRWYSHTD